MAGIAVKVPRLELLKALTKKLSEHKDAIAKHEQVTKQHEQEVKAYKEKVRKAAAKKVKQALKTAKVVDTSSYSETDSYATCEITMKLNHSEVGKPPVPITKREGYLPQYGALSANQRAEAIPVLENAITLMSMSKDETVNAETYKHASRLL